MTGIFHVFLIGHLLFTGNGIHLYMCEDCLDLPRCATDASPFYELIIPGHEALVYAILVSLIFLAFRDEKSLR